MSKFVGGRSSRSVGAHDKILGKVEKRHFFDYKVYVYAYTPLMKTLPPSQILREINQIRRMEPGKLCVIRRGAKGAFYNLQYRENGKAISQYVPRDQAEAVAQNTANYQKFEELVGAYAKTIVQATREERVCSSKKKTRKYSAGSKTKNFSS